MANAIYINEVDGNGSQDLQIHVMEAERGPAGKDGAIQYSAGHGIRINNNVISATGGGSGDSPFIPLTNADANYVDVEDGTPYIALWKLDSGLYCLDENATVDILVSLDGPDFSKSDEPFIFNTNGTSAIIYYSKIVYSGKGVSYEKVKTNGTIDESKSQFFPLSNFVGGGILDGKAGLVPAPTTSDMNKFLNSDGTWKAINDGTLTIQQNGTTVTTFSADSSTNKTANITAPVITLQTTDPGEGVDLAANNFIGIYT